MPIDRREFVLATASALMSTTFAAPVPVLAGAETSRFKAIAFDAFPIFDPRPVAEMTESLFPGQGLAIMEAWRARQFEYQWLRALAGQYVDFLQTTEEGLIYAAKRLQLDLSSEQRHRLMATYENLQVWPDAPAAVQTLRDAGLRLVFLSNMTRAALEQGLHEADMRQAFEAVLSTDAIGSYKPDPKAYQMGLDALGLERNQILFVAFAGWDVAGAKWFGYPTYWVNRLGSPMEELGVEPDGEGRDLEALVRFVIGKDATSERG